MKFLQYLVCYRFLCSEIQNLTWDLLDLARWTTTRGCWLLVSHYRGETRAGALGMWLCVVRSASRLVYPT